MSLAVQGCGRRAFPLRGPLVGVDLSRDEAAGMAESDPLRKPAVKYCALRNFLFDHLVGNREHARRNVDAERPRR
jgi:hypothetical protein